MNDVEELLTRTLRDPGRALPPPADPVRAIRARARRQRRTTALAAAAVVLVAAAALTVPAALSGPDPAPVATDPGPVPDLPAGGLRWEPRGPLLGDAALIRGAEQAWQGVPVDGPVGAIRPVWAGRLGDARVVVLQASGSDGKPLLAEVGDRDGRLSVLRIDDVWDPDAPVLRLVDPGSPDAGTRLLVRPGGEAIVLLGEGDGSNPGPDRDGDGDGESDPLYADRSGVRADVEDLARQQYALLDGDGRVVDSGVVPLRQVLSTSNDSVRLVEPRTFAATIRPPRPADLVDGVRVSTELPGTGPVRVAVVELTGTFLAGDRLAVPRFYELERGGRRWVAGELQIDGRSACLRITEGWGADAVLLRCPVPSARDGVIAVALHRGVELAGIRLGSFQARYSPQPGQDGLLISTGPEFPTGGGELELVNADGTRRTPFLVPPYRP